MTKKMLPKIFQPLLLLALLPAISAQEDISRFQGYNPLRDCGSSLSPTESGEVLSPAYPEPYPPGMTCTWTISLLPGQALNITFTDFNLAPKYSPNRFGVHSAKCVDYVELTDHDGEDVLFRSCGGSEYNRTWMFMSSLADSDTRHIQLMFRSSDQTHAGERKFKGFKLHYNVTKSRFVCGETSLAVASTPQVLHSPGWPRFYPNNVICTWKLKLDPGLDANIQLKFEKFRLQAPNALQLSDDRWHYLCGDYVMIREEGSRDVVFCGDLAPSSWVSRNTSDEIEVSFHSNSDGESEQGFIIHYRARTSQDTDIDNTITETTVSATTIAATTVTATAITTSPTYVSVSLPDLDFDQDSDGVLELSDGPWIVVNNTAPIKGQDTTRVVITTASGLTSWTWLGAIIAIVVFILLILVVLMFVLWRWRRTKLQDAKGAGLPVLAHTPGIFVNSVTDGTEAYSVYSGTSYTATASPVPPELDINSRSTSAANSPAQGFLPPQRSAGGAIVSGRAGGGAIGHYHLHHTAPAGNYRCQSVNPGVPGGGKQCFDCNYDGCGRCCSDGGTTRSSSINTLVGQIASQLAEEERNGMRGLNTNPNRDDQECRMSLSTEEGHSHSESETVLLPMKHRNKTKRNSFSRVVDLLRSSSSTRDQSIPQGELKKRQRNASGGAVASRPVTTYVTDRPLAPTTAARSNNTTPAMNGLSPVSASMLQKMASPQARGEIHRNSVPDFHAPEPPADKFVTSVTTNDLNIGGGRDQSGRPSPGRPALSTFQTETMNETTTTTTTTITETLVEKEEKAAQDAANIATMKADGSGKPQTPLKGVLKPISVSTLNNTAAAQSGSTTNTSGIKRERRTTQSVQNDLLQPVPPSKAVAHSPAVTPSQAMTSTQPGSQGASGRMEQDSTPRYKSILQNKAGGSKKMKQFLFTKKHLPRQDSEDAMASEDRSDEEDYNYAYAVPAVATVSSPSPSVSSSSYCSSCDGARAQPSPRQQRETTTILTQTDHVQTTSL